LGIKPQTSIQKRDIQKRVGNFHPSAKAARLGRKTALPLPWIAARLQAGSWKSRSAKRHR
jgi:hypothetical protein